MRRFINAGVSVLVAATLALLFATPAFAEHAPTTNWLEEVPGYSGKYDNWGDGLVYWWGEKLGVGEDADISVESTPFYYVERGMDTGVIAMDDSCWIPSNDDQSAFERYNRTLDGIEGPVQVSREDDADLRKALMCLGIFPWLIVLAAGIVVGTASGGIAVFAMRTKKKREATAKA
jgi:hypothetical protein